MRSRPQLIAALDTRSCRGFRTRRPSARAASTARGRSGSGGCSPARRLSRKLVQHPLVLGISARRARALVRHDPAQSHPGARASSRRAAAASAPRPGHVARRDRRDRISGQCDVAVHPLHARKWRDRDLARAAMAAARSTPRRRRANSPSSSSPARRCSSSARRSTAPAAMRSNEVRRGAIVSYCLGWLKPYENQWLAYPPEVAQQLHSRARRPGRIPAAPAQPRQLRRAMSVGPAPAPYPRPLRRDRCASARPGSACCRIRVADRTGRSRAAAA